MTDEQIGCWLYSFLLGSEVDWRHSFGITTNLSTFLFVLSKQFDENFTTCCLTRECGLVGLMMDPDDPCHQTKCTCALIELKKSRAGWKKQLYHNFYFHKYKIQFKSDLRMNNIQQKNCFFKFLWFRKNPQKKTAKVTIDNSLWVIRLILRLSIRFPSKPF